MYHRIIVPIDGSQTSNQALATALRMARESQGCIRLVHVVEELAYLTGYDQFGGYSGDLIKVMRETGGKILADGMAMAQAQGVACESALYDNFGERLPEVVADEARRWQADLIVVGTHGRTGLSHVLLGSVAERVVQTAPCPVLTVRSPKSGGRARAKARRK
jgi:nucleotide-binding universal stress UspA family protein